MHVETERHGLGLFGPLQLCWLEEAGVCKSAPGSRLSRADVAITPASVYATEEAGGDID
jgi:hypothetical protein